MKIHLLLIACVLSFNIFAQCSNTVSPATTSVNCLAGGTIVSFTATSLSPTINVRHDWYSPLNPLPGGAPILSSTNAVSVLSGAFSPGIYTVTTTDLGTLCQVSKTFQITSPDAFPYFNVVSSSPSVGCAGGTTTLSFIAAVSQQTPPSTISNTFLPPNFIGPLTPSVVLGNNASTVTSIFGTWTLVVQDNSNFCRAMLPLPLYQSATSINFNYTVLPGGVVNFQSTSTGTNGGTTYSWDFGDGTQGSGATTSHTYSNGGIHNVTLISSNPSCNSNAIPVNVNTIPCLANSNFTLVYSGNPQNWLAYPSYYGNVINANWNWGDGSSTNAMFPVHTYSAAGLYNICLSVTVSCAGSSSTCAGYNIFKSVNTDMAMVTVSVVSLPPLSVQTKNNEKIEFEIYPNPSQSSFYFINSSKLNGELVIYDASGKTIKNYLVKSDSNEEIKDLSAGFYIIELKTENSYTRKKHIVE